MTSGEPCSAGLLVLSPGEAVELFVARMEEPVRARHAGRSAGLVAGILRVVDSWKPMIERVVREGRSVLPLRDDAGFVGVWLKGAKEAHFTLFSSVMFTLAPSVLLEGNVRVAAFDALERCPNPQPAQPTMRRDPILSLHRETDVHGVKALHDGLNSRAPVFTKFLWSVVRNVPAASRLINEDKVPRLVASDANELFIYTQDAAVVRTWFDPLAMGHAFRRGEEGVSVEAESMRTARVVGVYEAAYVLADTEMTLVFYISLAFKAALRPLQANAKENQRKTHAEASTIKRRVLETFKSVAACHAALECLGVDKDPHADGLGSPLSVAWSAALSDVVRVLPFKDFCKLKNMLNSFGRPCVEDATWSQMLAFFAFEGAGPAVLTAQTCAWMELRDFARDAFFDRLRFDTIFKALQDEEDTALKEATAIATAAELLAAEETAAASRAASLERSFAIVETQPIPNTKDEVLSFQADAARRLQAAKAAAAVAARGLSKSEKAAASRRVREARAAHDASKVALARLERAAKEEAKEAQQTDDEARRKLVRVKEQERAAQMAVETAKQQKAALAAAAERERDLARVAAEELKVHEALEARWLEASRARAALEAPRPKLKEVIFNAPPKLTWASRKDVGAGQGWSPFFYTQPSWLARLCEAAATGVAC